MGLWCKHRGRSLTYPLDSGLCPWSPDSQHDFQNRGHIVEKQVFSDTHTHETVVDIPCFVLNFSFGSHEELFC